MDELQKRGATARALGRSLLDNPLYHSTAMPAWTGETIEEWTAKVEAWQLGWEMENAIRA